MPGEDDLGVLLRDMQPELNPGSYVFSWVTAIPAGVQPVATMAESEGISVVVAQSIADQLGLEYDSVFAWITLTVFSSLHAVGLTAAVSHALTVAGISCNVVAGFHHDHLFVPYELKEQALEALHELVRR